MSEQLAVATKPFTYSGPTSGASLRLPDGQLFERMLFDGKTVELPPEHPHVLRLIARGHLMPVELTPADAPSARLTMTVDNSGGAKSRGRKPDSAASITQESN